MLESTLIALFLPEGLLDNFDLIKIETVTSNTITGKTLHIYLDERNNLEQSTRMRYESKGFMSSKKIKDFPIRGNEVYIILRRRRWRCKSSDEPDLIRRLSLTSKGVKVTKELADFLKSLAV